MACVRLSLLSPIGLEYTDAMSMLRTHRALSIAIVVAVLLSLLPIWQAWHYIGSNWRGVVQSYGDEILYDVHVHEIGDGHPLFGNPYFIEHANDIPLVVFAGVYVAAVPYLLGMPLDATIFFDYTLWSVIVVVLGYWLLRELLVPRTLAAIGSLFALEQYSGLIWRMSNRQEVNPVFLLFYIGLIRLIRDPRTSNIVLVGVSAGLSFWVFSYLWQAVVITLGLLLVYALVARLWVLARAVCLAGVLGVVLGSPVLLYQLWQSHTQPYFWESIARFGLVHSHLPMAEIVYSGGWVWVLCAVIFAVWWRVPQVRDQEFKALVLFAAVSGMGLWIEQGSNAITGQLLELGEHLKPSIVTWLAFATVAIGWALWERRERMSQGWQYASGVGVALLLLVSVYFGYAQFEAFLFQVNVPVWQEQQTYAAPLQWIDAHETAPVVIWADPHDYFVQHVPVLSRDYVLSAEAAMYHLVSNQEIRERYLVSQYFNNPSPSDLQRDIRLYMGNQDVYHNAKTIERGIKLCRIFFFWDHNHNCGVVPTSLSLLGDSFFASLETQFATDIKPHIKEYLQKYHVAYIVKDDVLDPQYQPQKLGAVRVYSDGRFEIYKLP